MWNSKVGIDFLYYVDIIYYIELNGDLRNVSSYLFFLLNKFVGEVILVNIQVDGNLKSFVLMGSVGSKNYFNSCWLLNQKLMLDWVIWMMDSWMILLLFV